MTEFHQALAEYATAIERRVFWEDHGSWGDGKLDEAKQVERAARRKVLSAHRASLRVLASK